MLEMQDSRIRYILPFAMPFIELLFYLYSGFLGLVFYRKSNLKKLLYEWYQHSLYDTIRDLITDLRDLRGIV